MDDFRNRVAVITGGASGIGLGLAQRCLEEGMHVVLADVEDDALSAATSGFRDAGYNNVLPVLTDVSIREQVEALAYKTMEEFGTVHLLFNNAGVGAGGDVTSTTYDEWEWVMGVNLWSVIYGFKTFVPLMEQHGEPAHIVNTASTAGIVYGSMASPYATTKHAVVALSESAFGTHQARGSNVGVSVLCPHFTATRILESDRNFPGSRAERSEAVPAGPEAEAFMAEFRRRVAEGMQPSELAAIVFRAIREKRFYILTDDEANPVVLERAQAITSSVLKP